MTSGSVISLHLPGRAEAPASFDDEVSLCDIRKRLHPRAVHGSFAAWRIVLLLATQALFYGVPWLVWNGRQALLLDLEARKFYVAGWIFWPQDVIYLALLMIQGALALFLFTAVAGRLWCGYACPQTVYTGIFAWIERKIEGDRLARIRLDAAPPSLKKFTLRGFKHLAWLTIAIWTGLTFVGYFSPIRDLALRAITWQLGGWEAFWILFYSFATYGNAGFMRERVCKSMCPYARLQSLMFDRDTLVIGYDAGRGEPRGSRPQSADPKSRGLGDCIDCSICVQVCPTGIDIRQGLQYECIGCAACVDGCNQVMAEMGYPKGLIRYASENTLAERRSAVAMWRRAMRPRVLTSATAVVALGIVVAVMLAMRTPQRVDVKGDRGTHVGAFEFERPQSPALTPGRRMTLKSDAATTPPERLRVRSEDTQ